MAEHALRHQRLHAVLALLLLHCLLATPTAIKVDFRAKCIRSVPRSFTQSQQETLCVQAYSDSVIQTDPTAPGKCAKLALGGRSLQSAKFAPRVELLRASSIVNLCAGVQHPGPAKCWLAVPSHIRHQILASTSSTHPEAATVPLVQVCRHAHNDVPAKCLLLWLKMSSTMNNQDAQIMLGVATTLCENFGGQIAALEKCVKQATPHLRPIANSQIDVLKLCQYIGSGADLPAVVECASELGKKYVTSSIIAQLCSRASTVERSTTRPHICFLEAQRKLSWMGQAEQVALCKDAAAQSAIDPVDCALEIKNRARALISSTRSFSAGSAINTFVANACYRATNASDVVECIRLLPGNTFTPNQALRLCAASTMPSEDEDNTAVASIHRTSCASQVRKFLHRSIAQNGNTAQEISASAAAVRVCENATSSAPSKCLADTQFDRSLSVSLRIQLCQQASSDAPQECLKALRKYVNAERLEISDAVATCQQTKSLGPAECLIALFRAPVLVKSKSAAQLCQAAKDSEPARCFLASPPSYGDAIKVELCQKSESTAPALCAATVISRLGNNPSHKAALCRGATSQAPATCAIEAPFGIDFVSLVSLCQNAVSIAPAECARAVPSSLGIPWHQVAQVCTGATTTFPGRCLVHHIRRSRLTFRILGDNQIVSECRLAMAQPSSLEIAKAAYSCPELRPMCHLQIVINVLDQYGGAMLESSSLLHRSGDIVRLNAALNNEDDQLRNRTGIRRQVPSLQGPSYAMIINGTAVFSDLLFTGTGEFTLTFHAGEGITEEVVRVVVHPDHIAEALEMRCDALFSRFQCSSRPSSPTSRNHQQHELQTLLLQRSLQLNAISCEQYWLVSIGGLTFSGLSLHGDVVYTMPRSLYILSTNTDVPHADMSPWDLLGLREGAVSRADIRRAYHRKSLEWHPDKWHSLLVALPSVWQQELIAIYALVSQAYDQLLRN